MKNYNCRVYVIGRAWCVRVLAVVFASVISALAQQSRPAKSADSALALPKASLWNHYSFQFQPSGENGPYHWRMIGAAPHGLTLHENGVLSGETEDQGERRFTVLEMDPGGNQKTQNCVLAIEAPLMTAWSKHARVSGNRVDGAIKVSNTTGRDFDLTFVVLAVNDIGRATAIGYQHFSLKQNTRNFELPFGDTLSPGNYVVNVDVVGEEPQSNMIFRSRLVSGKEEVIQGP